jgi:hypothetical protein
MSWSKAFSTKPKRKKPKDGLFQPIYRKKPVEMGGLMADVLKRHNIGKQVSSAMIVTSAHEWLQQALPDHVKPDVKAHAYQDGQLRIACRHAGSISFVEEQSEALRQHLLQLYPSHTMESIRSRVHPAAWGEEAW